MTDIRTVSKAIAGAIVTAVVAYLARKGIVLGADVSEAANILLAAVIGFAFVYISPKNKE